MSSEGVYVLSSIRVKFIRGEEARYISHLDLMRVFERALRRSNIPIAYSQGFNPHQQMVFGLPLSVGVTSEAEYADFDFEIELEPLEFMERLNRELPKGLRIVEAKQKQVKANIMASIVMASYKVFVYDSLKMGINELEGKIKRFMLEPVIIVKRVGKNGIKNVDIKSMILKLDVEIIDTDEASDQFLYHPNASFFCFSMLLSAGGKANLKPELLVEAFNERTDSKLKIFKIHRTELFTEYLEG